MRRKGDPIVGGRATSVKKCARWAASLSGRDTLRNSKGRVGSAYVAEARRPRTGYTAGRLTARPAHEQPAQVIAPGEHVFQGDAWSGVLYVPPRCASGGPAPLM